MVAPGQAVEIRTVDVTGSEVWEPGILDRIEGALYYVRLATAVALPGKAGKKHIDVVPVMVDSLRVVPSEPDPEPPTIMDYDQWNAMQWQRQSVAPKAASAPAFRDTMTYRERQRYDMLNAALQPGTKTINAATLMIVLMVGLIIGAIIGMAVAA